MTTWGEIRNSLYTQTRLPVRDIDAFIGRVCVMDEQDEQEFEAFKATGIYGLIDGRKIHPVRRGACGYDVWEDEQGHAWSVSRPVRKQWEEAMRLDQLANATKGDYRGVK